MGKIRGKWDETNMKEAIDRVISKELTIRDASARYSVPKSTLADRVKIIAEGGEVIAKPCTENRGTFQRTFEENHEKILYNHVKALDSQLMPLSKVEFLKLAYQLAEKLKINHRFNKEKQMAGKDFYYHFMSRHQDLRLRTAESTSLQRAVGFSKDQVTGFFDKLTELMDKHKFSPSKIFNVDETGVSCVHTNSLKVMSIKGKKQVGKLTSAERGRNVTILLSINATGDQFIPPLFVFPRVRIDNDLKRDAPLGSIFDGQKSGWITKEGFLKWLHTFVDRVNPNEKNPVLLILDGHGSHKDLDVILYAKEHHIHMISLPPHTSHRLQPLDRSIMKPFKNAYNETCALWMRKYPNMKISLKDIAGLVNTAFSRICRMELAQSGFSCTGIYPLNRNVFCDLDFAASLYNQSQEVEETFTTMSQTSTNFNKEALPQPPTVCSLPGPLNQPNNQIQDQHSTAGTSTSCSLPGLSSQPDNQTHEPSTILEQISPLPSTSSVKYKERKSRSEKSEILTSSPYKKQLLEKRRLLEEKNAKIEEKKKLKEIKQKGKGAIKISKGKRDKTARKKLKFDDFNTRSASVTNCIFCGESFDEDWIQCHVCKGWAHENCANVEGDSLFYYCDICEAKK